MRAINRIGCFRKFWCVERKNKTKMTLVDLQDELFMAQSILMTAPISQRTARQAEAGESLCWWIESYSLTGGNTTTAHKRSKKFGGQLSNHTEDDIRFVLEKQSILTACRSLSVRPPVALRRPRHHLTPIVFKSSNFPRSSVYKNQLAVLYKGNTNTFA